MYNGCGRINASAYVTKRRRLWESCKDETTFSSLQAWILCVSAVVCECSNHRLSRRRLCFNMLRAWTHFGIRWNKRRGLSLPEFFISLVICGIWMHFVHAFIKHLARPMTFSRSSQTSHKHSFHPGSHICYVFHPFFSPYNEFLHVESFLGYSPEPISNRGLFTSTTNVRHHAVQVVERSQTSNYSSSFSTPSKATICRLESLKPQMIFSFPFIFYYFLLYLFCSFIHVTAGSKAGTPGCSRLLLKANIKDLLKITHISRRV